MRKNPDLPMLTSLRRATWEPVLFQGCPSWQQAVRRVQIIGDLSEMTFNELDYIFAIFASNGGTMFSAAATGPHLERWLASVEKRSIGAAEKYERRVKAHFRKYKNEFTEGYTLPEKPTPQLRVIYDSAAKSERRPIRPCGTTLRSGFSGGEYHWRPWPLGNVAISDGEES
jgi:hypothetical protein